MAKLAHPRDDARWLFAIDTLLQGGADPLTIVKGLGIDPAAFGVSLGKYSPDQPRVSAGNPNGGQWTSETSEGATGAPQPIRIKGVQVADASPDWARCVKPNIEVNQLKTNVAASSRSTILQPRGSNFVTDVNISCEEIAESDLAICRSAIFDDDPQFHGECMKGMLRRMNDCAAGRPLSPLLPY